MFMPDLKIEAPGCCSRLQVNPPAKEFSTEATLNDWLVDALNNSRATLFREIERQHESLIVALNERLKSPQQPPWMRRVSEPSDQSFAPRGSKRFTQQMPIAQLDTLALRVDRLEKLLFLTDLEHFSAIDDQIRRFKETALNVNYDQQPDQELSPEKFPRNSQTGVHLRHIDPETTKTLFFDIGENDIRDAEMTSGPNTVDISERKVDAYVQTDIDKPFSHETFRRSAMDIADAATQADTVGELQSLVNEENILRCLCESRCLKPWALNSITLAFTDLRIEAIIVFLGDASIHKRCTEAEEILLARFGLPHGLPIKVFFERCCKAA